MMKRMWVATSVAVVLSLGGSTQAFTEEPMIEVGVGGAVLGSSSPVDLLFRVDVEGERTSSSFFVVTVDGEVAANPREISYVDFTIAPFAFGRDEPIGFSPLETQFTRNTALGNEYMLRSTVIAMRGDIKAPINDQTHFLLKFSSDVLTLGLFKNRDGQTHGAWGIGMGMATGVEVEQKYRVILGAKLSALEGFGKRERGTGEKDCDWVESDHCSRDRDGDESCHTHRRYVCREIMTTVHDDGAVEAKAYLDAVMDLTETLSLFGRVDWAMYGATATRDEINLSDWKSGLQFFAGVSGKW